MPIPFQLLHTFVVVVRSKRMDRAAEALGVSPGAISQRIRELEALMETRLLDRSRLGVAATRAGEQLFRRVRDPLEKIAADYTAMADRRSSHRIVINTVASFAALWLVPRLGSFTASHPDIEVAIETDARAIDLMAEPVDLVIRHGLGSYEGLMSHWLFAPELIIVASPKLVQKGPGIRRLADCLHYPLLHDIERQDWRMLFAASGLKAAVPRTGPAFADDHLLVQAAVAGQGLALVSTAYANSEVDSGRLVNPLTVRWPRKFAYYLVGRPQSFRRAPVRKFKDWILGQSAPA